MIITLFGPPGSGKGTQSGLLKRHLGMQEVSTGNLLRLEAQQDTEFGHDIKAKLAFGKLVDDQVVIEILKNKLSTISIKKLILDGFPRTVEQAKRLEQAHIKIDKIIEIVVPESILLQRLTGRMVHLASGRVYHTEYAPPKVSGIDDVTGEPLVIREDDTAEVLKNRLKIYHQQTMPVIEWYKNSGYRVFSVDGSGNILTLYNEIASIVEKA